MTDSPPPGPIKLSPLWLLFAALVLAVPLGALWSQRRPAPSDLPVLAELPAFSLVDQDGKAFDRARLLGKVWVADFFFTSCPTACPLLTRTMKRLGDRLDAAERPGISLLSISVDPERDTPEKLRAYAKEHAAESPSWSWLTGPELEVQRAVVEGFRMVRDRVPREGADAGSAAEVRSDAFDLLHGEKFVLVDARARIRGYYDVGEPHGVEALLRDARALRAEAAP